MRKGWESQNYEFWGGEHLVVSVFLDPTTPAEAREEIFRRCAREAAEAKWEERFPGKFCPPGALVGERVRGNVAAEMNA
jgi:hypothetical protein